MLRFVVLSALLGSSTVIHAQDLTVDLLVYPAGIFEVSDRSIGGPGTAMLDRLQAVSGVQFKQQLMPVARALLTVAKKPRACLVALPRLPERENQYRWAGPWASGTSVLYGRADETRRVDGPADIRTASVAVLRESRQAVWLKEHGLMGHEVNDVRVGLRMLQVGRVDFWLSSDISARYVIKMSGGPAPRTLYSFGRVELHLACNPAMEASTVDRLQAGIDQLRRNGELTEFGLK